MGDLRGWSPETNGVAAEDRAAENGAEFWRLAEDTTQGIIAKVQPTVVSEKRRKAVVDFVQDLLKFYLGCEVFPFGSVPLKTYLPDGDIDLTAFCGTNHEEAFANDVYSVLESQERNTNMEFVVKDVQLIRAEVKLIKCLMQNIVVDISFTQLGGLCTLSFLERVDRLIGKDHIFKRSIILIKAWCYYESRILGAHHGLISTYALETLVLYIFHVFHYSLNGPLAVLYKFLDYFSNFDWDNYCISLNGPVRISNLPELTAELPENGGRELLLSDDFLKGCVERFSVPCEPNSKTFMQKHFNIVDPLKENNNLGRSVSKGNFFRIRSAFSYGARKLFRVLSQAEDNIGPEVEKFFGNTLERHGKGQRPDILDYHPMQVYDLDATRSSEISGYYEQSSLNNNVEISGTEDDDDDDDAFSDRSSVRGLNVNSISDEVPATLRLEGLVVSNGGPKKKASSRQHFSRLSVENGETSDDDETQVVGSKPPPKNPSSIEEEFRSDRNSGFIRISPTIECCDSLADLSGDYESHIESLSYGRWFHECTLSGPVSPPVGHMVPNYFHQKKHFSQVHRAPFYHLAPPILPVFGGEDIAKPRGTGTYFPNANHYRDRPITPRGRNQAMLRSPRGGNGNGRFPATFPAENGFHERNILRDAAQPHFPVPVGPVKSGSSDVQCGSPHVKVVQNANGSMNSPEHFIEFGSIVHLPPEPPLLRRSWQANLGSSVVQSSIVSPVEDKQKPMLSLDKDRISAQAYRLKDEDDFPPLSV